MWLSDPMSEIADELAQMLLLKRYTFLLDQAQIFGKGAGLQAVGAFLEDHGSADRRMMKGSPMASVEVLIQTVFTRL